jgi:glycosyltransferase involved in cell wall biosynthesis
MKASVIICCYNQQDTIGGAIKSVLGQRTEFPYEVIVVDDGSSDNTYKNAARFEGGSVYVMGLIHVGMMTAYEIAFGFCEGEYILFCDGDDYWIDDDKMQKQVDFMESTPDVGICLTKVYTMKNGSGAGMVADNSKFTFDNILKGCSNIYAQSYCIRKTDFDKYIDFDKFVRMGFRVWDLPIVLELIRHSGFYCMDFYGGVFTVLPESVTHTNNRIKRLKYILGNYKIRIYYILKYGCKLGTAVYLIYRFTRDIYAIIFKRWTK